MSRPLPTVAEVLAEARRRLGGAPFEAPPREAGLLLRRVLGLSEAALWARPERLVGEDERRRFEALLERRLSGEPVAYLFGERELWGRDFAVDSRVLVPRPETEHLVEAVLGLELPEAPWILDVGAGSGAIAVTLALELPRARVVASDLSLGALAVTAKNARRHGASVALLASDLGAALRLERFDVVVSNPPYIDPAAASTLSPEVVDHEPHLALFAPEGGRGVVSRLLDEARAMRPGAWLLLEIGHDQADWLTDAAAERPYLVLREIVQDYGGVPRTAVLERHQG